MALPENSPKNPMEPGRMIESAKQYYARVDSGSPDLLELFTPDFQFYFPKFGIGVGADAFMGLGAGLHAAIQEMSHLSDTFLYLPSGDHLVVEGLTQGTGRDGGQWKGGETPGGRFCSVFHFKDGLISRMHIYLDPDYLGQDASRFYAGHVGRVW